MACSGGVEPDSGGEEPGDSGARDPDDDDATHGSGNSANSSSSDNTTGSNDDSSEPGQNNTRGDGGGVSNDTDTDNPDDTNDTSASDEPEVEGAVAVRLTQVELNHVLRDLLGDTFEPARLFVAEDEYSPFDNDAQRQTVSASLIDSISVLADDVASRLAYDSQARSAWMPCEPDSDTDATCFDATISALGERFLRRHVTQDEVVRYRALLEFAAERQDFYAAVELLLNALIQDPEFLYRLERGTPNEPTVLSDYEVATRLSFVLLGSTPDDALLHAARDGGLRTAEARRAEALRLLNDDSRARTQLNRFHAMWLGYRAIPHDATLNAAFQLETEHLIERVVFDQPQNYLQLFRSNETYINSLLAEHYGFDEPSGGEGWVTYPDEALRAGILAHGSVLSAFSKFSDTSPTQRGIFVRTRLLCLGVPSAPPTVDVDQPPGGEDAADACKSERYRLHREQSGCADCHRLFEPIGMGLEQFDRAGRFREHDDDNEECVIESVGEVPGIGTFSGPKELAMLLTDGDAIQACMVRHYMQYALARTKLSATELTWVDQANAEFSSGGLQLKDWIVNLVSQDAFARREVTP